MNECMWNCRLHGIEFLSQLIFNLLQLYEIKNIIRIFLIALLHTITKMNIVPEFFFGGVKVWIKCQNGYFKYSRFITNRLLHFVTLYVYMCIGPLRWTNCHNHLLWTRPMFTYQIMLRLQGRYYACMDVWSKYAWLICFTHLLFCCPFYNLK